MAVEEAAAACRCVDPNPRRRNRKAGLDTPTLRGAEKRSQLLFRSEIRFSLSIRPDFERLGLPPAQK
jgi:hypothetical protein